MTWPFSGTGRSTTDFTWRTTSTVTSRPLGMRTRSRSTSKTFPVNTRSCERRSASDILEMLFHLAPLNIVEHVLEVGRQRRVELHPPAVGGVCERQVRRVQERPLQPLHGAQVRRDPPMHAAVGRVADDRVADGAEVDAN